MKRKLFLESKIMRIKENNKQLIHWSNTGGCCSGAYRYYFKQVLIVVEWNSDVWKMYCNTFQQVYVIYKFLCTATKQGPAFLPFTNQLQCMAVHLVWYTNRIFRWVRFVCGYIIHICTVWHRCMCVGELFVCVWSYLPHMISGTLSIAMLLLLLCLFCGCFCKC